jgi:hypothetical protein
MSVAFSGSTDRIDFGSAASLDDIPVFTLAAWMKPTSLALTRVLFTKGGSSGKRFRLFGATSSGSLQFVTAMSATNGSAQTAAATYTINAWQFVAATYDASFNAKIYRMALGGAMTDVSGTVVQGTGTIATDAASSMLVGGDATNPFPGDLAEVFIIPAALNIGQLTALAYGSMPRECRLYAPLFGVPTTEPDYSGNKNNGTLTGSAAGTTHPPVRSRFDGLASAWPDRTITGGGATTTAGYRSLLGVGI